MIYQMYHIQVVFIINLLDTIVAPATLTVDVGGDIVLDADGGDVFIKDNGSTLIQLSNNTIVVGEAIYGNSSITYDGDDLLEFASNELKIFNYLKIVETANANSDTSGRGKYGLKMIHLIVWHLQMMQGQI